MKITDEIMEDLASYLNEPPSYTIPDEWHTWSVECDENGVTTFYDETGCVAMMLPTCQLPGLLKAVQ